MRIWLGGYALDEPAEQTRLQGVEDIGQIGVIALGLVFGQGVVGGAGEGFGEVGGEELGVEILADGFGEFAGELFDVEAVFEDFEGLLDVPAGVVETFEVCGGKGLRVEERGREDLDGAGGQDDADQAKGDGVVDQVHTGRLCLSLSGLGELEGHDRFGLAGEQEALDTGPLSPVHPSQERQAALLQQGEQPDGGKAAIQDEEVVAGKVWEQLRQEGTLGLVEAAEDGLEHQA